MGTMAICEEESRSNTKPVGPLLATGGNDKVICLWDLHAAAGSAQAEAIADPFAAPGLLAKMSHGQKVGLHHNGIRRHVYCVRADVRLGHRPRLKLEGMCVFVTYLCMQCCCFCTDNVALLMTCR